MTSPVTLLVVLTVSLHLAAPNVAFAVFECFGGEKNGVVDAGEECDGGPLDNCCKDNCRWRSVGGDCVDPSNPCQKGNCQANHTCNLSSPTAVKGHPTCFNINNPCLEGECYNKNCVEIGNQPGQWAPRCKPDTDLCKKDECIVTSGGVFVQCLRTNPEDVDTNCSTASGATCTVKTCDGAGSCEATGNTIDCQGTLNVCHEWQCNPGNLSCSQVPVTVGTSCDTNEWDCFNRKCTSTGTCGNQEAGNGVRCDPSNPPDAQHCYLGTCTGSVCGTLVNVNAGVVQFDDPPSPPLCPSDGNTCTSDECNGNGACRNQNLANGSACDNANSCDTGETCTTGVCGTGTPVANNTLCSDGNPCTKNDVCMSGTCYGPEPSSCDDADPCTLDACTNPAGCSHTPSGCEFTLTGEIANPAATADDFGSSLAKLGTKLVVGAPNFADTHPGTAYLYDPASPSAPERTFQDPSPAGTTDHLGFSVTSLGTDKIVAGAPVSGTTEAGAALVFDATTGSLLHRFESTGSPRAPWGNPQLAPAINICGAGTATIGTDVLMGCPGEMRVYRFETATGTLVQTYTAPTSGNGSIGGALAVSGDRIAAGTGQILRYDFSTTAAQWFALVVFDADSGNLTMPGTGNYGEAVTTFGSDFLASSTGQIVWTPPPPYIEGLALIDPETGEIKHTVYEGTEVLAHYGSLGSLGSIALVGKSHALWTVGFDSNDEPVWVQQIASPGGGGANDRFGAAVVAIGSTIYVGAPGAANSASGVGAVYSFARQCGNATVDAGEECDDGNTKDGDCCSSSCEYESLGAPCDDNNKCTLSTCNATGTCTATGCQPNGLKCGNSCGTILYCQTSGSSCLCQ